MGKPINIGNLSLLRQSLIFRIQFILAQMKGRNPEVLTLLRHFQSRVEADSSAEITSREFYRIMVFGIENHELYGPLVDVVFQDYEPEFGQDVKAFFTQTVVRPSTQIH